MRAIFGLFLLAVFALGGCNSYGLRYQAIPQPKNLHIYADYSTLQDAIGISVDTDGQRLEEIYIQKGDQQIHPLNIAHAGYYQSAALGTGIGGFGNHVGGGVGLGIPVGPRQTHGLTSATFSQAAIGPPPWELHVNLHGVEEVTIPGLGGKPTAK
jgi:hypothetical protein